MEIDSVSLPLLQHRRVPCRIDKWRRSACECDLRLARVLLHDDLHDRVHVGLTVLEVLWRYCRRHLVAVRRSSSHVNPHRQQRHLRLLTLTPALVELADEPFVHLFLQESPRSRKWLCVSTSNKAESMKRSKKQSVWSPDFRSSQPQIE